MIQAFRAQILHLLDDPLNAMHPPQADYFDDGILVVEDGHVQHLGQAEAVLLYLPPACKVQHFPHHLLISGLIDTHIHYPQTDMIAAYGEQLLEWLTQYTFPTERQFADADHAAAVAAFFLEELFRNGTTTALVFSTVHPESVTALFQAALARNMRLITGKVLMDRNCPDYLQDTPERAYRESNALIDAWHDVGRLKYAITPRFAPTSSPEQLAVVQQLLAEHPSVYLHTHLAENYDEVAWVRALFPQQRSYLDVYQQYGMLKPRSVMAHCLHLDAQDRACMADAGAAVAFCPSSNLFIGSGLFPLNVFQAAGIRVGLGTDVGAGTSFSLFKTYQDAYKTQQLRGERLSPYQGLYLATLGAARALYLEDVIGNFQCGKEADFVVLDLECTPLLQRRLSACHSLDERLFALMMLADDRAVQATYVLGQCVYQRD